MSESQDHRQAAADLKCTAAQIKGIVPQVRRLDTIKAAAERRSARLEIAAEQAGLGARFFNLAAEIIGIQRTTPR